MLIFYYLLVSERRDHRKFKLTSRKNYERKKAAKKKAAQASVKQGGTKDEQQCTDTVSTLLLSLPLSTLEISEMCLVHINS